MDSFGQAQPNIEVAYKNAAKHTFNNGMKKYQNMFEEMFK
jgi:hypothetical protein